MHRNFAKLGQLSSEIFEIMTAYFVYFMFPYYFLIVPEFIIKEKIFLYLIVQEFNIFIKIMQDKKKYSSVYDLINLPKKRRLIPVHEDPFVMNQELDASQSQHVTAGIKESRRKLIDNVEKQLEIFDDTSFKFKFPPSKFPDVPDGERNKISYQQKVIVEDEDTFKPKLSEEQIRQIKEKGEFEVKSSKQHVLIPYVWKVNDCLVRGRVNIVNVWENGLAWCYTLLYEALDKFLTIIPQNLMKLVHLPGRFFSLIFGKKSLTAIYTPDYNRQVYKDFWTDIMQNQLSNIKDQISHEFLDLLYLKYQPAKYQQIQRDGQKKSNKQYEQLEKIRQQKIILYDGKRNKINDLKNALRQVQNKFQSNWVKIRKRVLIKASSEVQQISDKSMNESDDEPLKHLSITKKDTVILQKFHQEKFQIYTAHLKEHLPKQNLSSPAVQALIHLVTIISLIQAKIRLKDQRLRQIQQKTRSAIQKKYPIRSKNYNFIERALKQQYEPVRQRVQTQFYDNLIGQNSGISSRLNEKYKRIYQKYVQFKQDFDNLVQAKKSTLKCLYEPRRVFRTTYMLIPPYQVIVNNGYYSLKKREQMTVDTSTHFWKCRLYGMRMKSWTINCLVALLGLSWVGPFGLRCLFGIENFKYDENIEYNTGIKTPVTRPPFLGVFGKVLRGIKKSRDHFESLPDRGLFGKNFSRICNYIQCYLFRLVFVGILGVLILYPIAIVVGSLLCLVAVVTFWAWVPLVMVVCYLFNILVFQFQSSYRPSGCFVRAAPLLTLIVLIFISIISCLFAFIFLLVIAPLVCLIYFLFLILQRIGRTIGDIIMVCIIGKLGRTPSRDTAIAKKISGPGMSRNYFFSIAQEDVYVLTQCALQRILMNKFVELTRRQIESHVEKYNTIMKFVLQPFGYTRPSLNQKKDIVISNKNDLMNHFNTRVNYFMNRYPNYPYSVRFTQQQIDVYFENSAKIVKNFVEREHVKDWIFEQKQILYEDYDQLTRLIWIEVFSCGQEIFEPLETIDGRFKLVDDVTSNSVKMRQNVTSVMEALEGEVELSHRKANFNPAKRSLLDKDQYISCINNITTLHANNSQIYINVDLTDPSCILVPHRNLEELKAYDAYTRDKVARRKQKIIQQ